MTAPQPTHAIPRVDDTKPKSEPTWEGLYAQLLERHQRMHRAEARIAELERELAELRTSISDVSDDLLGTQDVAPPGELLARIARSHFEQRQRIAALSSARQSDRELVELRERAEGAERRVRELEARFDDMGNSLEANEPHEKLAAAEAKLTEWREWAKSQLLGPSALEGDDILRDRIDELIRECFSRLTAAKDRANEAEVERESIAASLRAAESRESTAWAEKHGADLELKELRKAMEELARAYDNDDESKRGDRAVACDIRCAMSKLGQEIIAESSAEADLKRTREGVKSLLSDLVTTSLRTGIQTATMTVLRARMEGLLATSSSTAPAEQSGRAGEGMTAKQATEMVLQGARVRDVGCDDVAIIDGKLCWRSSVMYGWTPYVDASAYEPFHIVKEPTP